MNLQKTLFILIIINFLIILSGMIFEFLMGKIFIPAIAIFFILNLALLIISIKKRNKLLIYTSSFGAGFFIGVILHNLFYALNTLTQIPILNFILEALHVVFFIIATIICPIGFLASIGVYLYKLTKK